MMRTININQEITSDELAALAVAVKMLDKAGVDTPTEEQLDDVALIVSGVSDLEYEYARKFLQSMIPFKMEAGVLV